MRLRRDLSGGASRPTAEAPLRLRLRRRRGSHMTVTLTASTGDHSVPAPRHGPVRVGTLSRIVSDVPAFLGAAEDDVRIELFGR